MLLGAGLVVTNRVHLAGISLAVLLAMVAVFGLLLNPMLAKVPAPRTPRIFGRVIRAASQESRLCVAASFPHDCAASHAL